MDTDSAPVCLPGPGVVAWAAGVGGIPGGHLGFCPHRREGPLLNPPLLLFHHPLSSSFALIHPRVGRLWPPPHTFSKSFCVAFVGRDCLVLIYLWFSLVFVGICEHKAFWSFLKLGWAMWLILVNKMWMEVAFFDSRQLWMDCDPSPTSNLPKFMCWSPAPSVTMLERAFKEVIKVRSKVWGPNPLCVLMREEETRDVYTEERLREDIGG